MSSPAVTKARPRGCFASITHSATTKSHLIESAEVIWTPHHGPQLIVATRCGIYLGIGYKARTYLELPEVHDLCDDCIFVGHLPAYELYRFFAADGSVLYIGQTCNFLNRLRGHFTSSPWWPEVDRWTHEPYDSLGEVLDAEIHAIRTEAPKYNRLHKSREIKGRAA